MRDFNNKRDDYELEEDQLLQKYRLFFYVV